MRYAFGAYILDAKRRELRDGGTAIPLRPKVFGLLSYLIVHRDRVVPKDELFDRLWPNVHVGDATLNTCVKAARRAVGDDGQTQAVIRTWHGHGYRFVAAVEEQPDDMLSPDAVATAPVAAAPADTAPPLATPLDAPQPEPDTPVRLPLPVVGPESGFLSGKEHKQVTVLHCVLDRAPQVAAELGPEDMDEVMDHFMAIVGEAVQRFGGVVTQWLSDGVVTLFGAPVAYEDHARRAVAAALGLQDALSRPLAAWSESLAARIGLHTGPVVVGLVGGAPGQVFTAVGTTTEAAYALQRVAPPGAILASRETYELVQAEVAAEPLSGAPWGIGETGPAYLIRGLTTRRSGVPRRGEPTAGPFVGRDRELAILRDRLAQLADAGGHVVSITGEPGIGKSRLVDEFQRDPASQGVLFLRTGCLSYAANSPYLPLRGLLRELCAAKETDPGADIVPKLATCLATAGIDSPVAVSLLGELMELPVDKRPLASLSPEEKRERIFANLDRLVGHMAGERPCVIVMEDLHWVDATSQDWLSVLVNRIAGLPVLLVATYRPGYRAPWLQQSSATQLALPRLTAEDSAAVVRWVRRSFTLTDAALNRIVTRAQGNPFFLEELARTNAGNRFDAPGIPDTVQAVLAARIDQLTPEDKRLLQMAAVVGPDVPMTLLGRIDDLDAAEREHRLLSLQQAELLIERHVGGQRAYAFKHALTQEVAYCSLLGRTRRAVHRRIADAMETDTAVLVGERPELLAHHLTQAGELARAISWWQAAGRRAADHSANVEAMSHFETALALIEDGKTRNRPADEPAFATRELDIVLALGSVMQMVKGPGSPDVGHLYAGARERGTAGASWRQQFEVLWGLWVNANHRGLYDTVKALEHELAGIARDSEDPELQLQASHAIWTSASGAGQWRVALRHTDTGMALAGSIAAPKPAYTIGAHDPIACAHGVRAIALMVEGYPERSAAEIASALALADALAHPPSLANVLQHAVDMHIIHRDVAALCDCSTRLASIAGKYGFAMGLAKATFARGWCRFHRGEASTAIAEMEKGLEGLAGVGRRFRESYARALLAEAYAASGDTGRACAIVEETLRVLADRGRGYWAGCEVSRLAGTVFLSAGAGREDQAEALFRNAMETADGQGARLLALRAATSLGRLLARSGRAGEAASLLRPRCDSFTEALDAPDLTAARALLDELAG